VIRAPTGRAPNHGRTWARQSRVNKGPNHTFWPMGKAKSPQVTLFDPPNHTFDRANHTFHHARWRMGKWTLPSAPRQLARLAHDFSCAPTLLRAYFPARLLPCSLVWAPLPLPSSLARPPSPLPAPRPVSLPRARLLCAYSPARPLPCSLACPPPPPCVFLPASLSAGNRPSQNGMQMRASPPCCVTHFGCALRRAGE
jgi:hypothetical protein